MSQQLSQEELKEFLDEKVVKYNKPDFIQTDPIQLPHRFHKKQDIEIVSFLVSTLAWGNRKAIIQAGEKLIQLMGNNPHEFVLNYTEDEIPFVYRTFNSIDLNAFLLSLSEIYKKYESLENVFIENQLDYSTETGIAQLRKQIVIDNFPKRTEKHIANIEKGSSCKRINMFLRWMVRPSNTGVDFGIWNKIPLSSLHLPLDVHTGNVARKLEILTRKQDDWKSVLEIQESLVKFDPSDPCKYDFALFGLGAFENW